MESSASIMEILPVEAIDLIVHHCEHDALKQLRLVNQLFNKLSTPRLFEHVYMVFFEESFNKFLSLAKSDLAQYVKRFTLLTDIIPGWSKKQWVKSLSHRTSVPRNELEYILSHQRIRFANNQGAGRTSNIVEARKISPEPLEATEVGSSPITDSELDEGWVQFMRLQTKRFWWSPSEQGLAFKEAFAMLPNVVEAEALATAPFLGPVEQMDVWARGRQRLRATKGVDFAIDSDYRNDELFNWRRVFSGKFGLCLLEAIGFRSSFAGASQITKLAMHVVHQETLRDLTPPVSSSPVNKLTLEESKRLHLAHDAFRHLTDVNLQIPHAIDCWRPGPRQSSTELCTLLSSAQNLRKLTLFCKERKTEAFIPPPQYHLFTLLSQTPNLWPHIEHLNLCIDTPSDILLSFLEALASSLRSLELRDMLVETPADIVERIPQILNLQHVYIESIWHGAHHDSEIELAEPYIRVLPFGTDVEEAKDVGKERARDLKEYLLGKREKMPDLYHLGDVWVRQY